MAHNVVATLQLAFSICLMMWLHARQAPAEKTWAGIDLKAALQGWPAYLRIALPSAAMICLDWWCFEVRGVREGPAGALLHPGVLVNHEP